MQLYRKDNNKFEINFSAFHSTYEVDTPMHSARQLDEQERQREIEVIQVRVLYKQTKIMNNISDAKNACLCLGKWQRDLTMHYVSLI